MNWTRISLILCTTLVVWSAANIHWGGQHHQGIIKADGRGYYAHLPAIFIYQDLNFGHYDSIEQGRYFNENYNYDYRKTYNGHVLNKYFSGTALAMLPFFAIGHGVSLISDWPADGYSKYYQLSISLAAICYLIATMMLMVKFLKCYNFHDVVIALTIPVMLFGSNWYYYVVSARHVARLLYFLHNLLDVLHDTLGNFILSKRLLASNNHRDDHPDPACERYRFAFRPCFF